MPHPRLVPSTSQQQRAFAVRVITRRVALGLSQVTLARRADLTPRAVAYLETGQREPSAGSLAGLARALEVSMDYLWSGELPRETQPVHIPAANWKHDPRGVYHGGQEYLEWLAAKDQWSIEHESTLSRPFTRGTEPDGCSLCGTVYWEHRTLRDGRTQFRCPKCGDLVTLGIAYQELYA